MAAEEPDPNAVGARIRQARLDLGLDQDEFASLVGVSERSLYGYENGERIPYKHLGKLTRATDLPRRWFLYGETTTEYESLERGAREGPPLGRERLERLEARVAELEERLREPPSSQASD